MARIGSLEKDGKRLTCKVGNEWPPVEILAYGGVQEARVKVSQNRYEQIRTWERVCGLMKMEIGKCEGCKNLVVDGTEVNPAGGRGMRPPSVHLSRKH